MQRPPDPHTPRWLKQRPSGRVFMYGPQLAKRADMEPYDPGYDPFNPPKPAGPSEDGAKEAEKTRSPAEQDPDLTVLGAMPPPINTDVAAPADAPVIHDSRPVGKLGPDHVAMRRAALSKMAKGAG